MDFDFSPFLARYQHIRAGVDKVFAQVGAAHPSEVHCGLGCSDCCHALFDLSLVEAMALNAAFNAKFAGKRRSAILARADEAERQGEKFKREAHKALLDGRPSGEILDMIAKARVRCPLLGEGDTCDLYEDRPITCRLYGIPLEIGGAAHTCGKSGFTAGHAYPTVHMEKLQDALLALSAEMAAAMHTRHTQLGEILVPVATALMNAYDEKYLGLGAPAGKKAARAKAPARPAPAASPADCSSCGQEKGSDQCASCGTLNWQLGAKPKTKPAPEKVAKKPQG